MLHLRTRCSFSLAEVLLPWTTTGSLPCFCGIATTSAGGSTPDWFFIGQVSLLALVFNDKLKHQPTHRNVGTCVSAHSHMIHALSLPLLCSVSVVTSGMASAGKEVTSSSVWLQSFVSCHIVSHVWIGENVVYLVCGHKHWRRDENHLNSTVSPQSLASYWTVPWMQPDLEPMTRDKTGQHRKATVMGCHGYEVFSVFYNYSYNWTVPILLAGSDRAEQEVEKVLMLSHPRWMCRLLPDTWHLTGAFTRLHLLHHLAPPTFGSYFKDRTFHITSCETTMFPWIQFVIINVKTFFLSVWTFAEKKRHVVKQRHLLVNLQQHTTTRVVSRNSNFYLRIVMWNWEFCLLGHNSEFNLIFTSENFDFMIRTLLFSVS